MTSNQGVKALVQGHMVRWGVCPNFYSCAMLSFLTSSSSVSRSLSSEGRVCLPTYHRQKTILGQGGGVPVELWDKVKGAACPPSCFSGMTFQMLEFCFLAPSFPQSLKLSRWM